MEIESLIHESVYPKVTELCSRVAERGGYFSVPPTPIVSPFWGTTFTPSSSEIIFRKIKSNEQLGERYCACQPCIRITDLPHLKDGWHLLLFHMISFTSFDVSSVEEELGLLIKMLTRAANCEVSDLYFTVSTSPVFSGGSNEISLGPDLLQKIGVPYENLFFCSGTANYQDASLNTSRGVEVSMTGPKVEIFVQEENDELKEIGTFELAVAGRNASNEDVFAFVIGLERTAAIGNRSRSVANLPVRKDIIDQIRQEAFKDSFSSTSIAQGAVTTLVALIDALAHILSSTQGGGPEFAIKGLRNHYNRVVKTFRRVADSNGIPYELVLENVIDNKSRVPSKLIKSELLDKPSSDRPGYG